MVTSINGNEIQDADIRSFFNTVGATLITFPLLSVPLLFLGEVGPRFQTDFCTELLRELERQVVVNL